MKNLVTTEPKPLPVIQSKKPSLKPAVTPVPKQKTYHRSRRIVQSLCFIGFLILPFFNVMRFDIPRQRFYFAGYELWINEFAIIFFAMMFTLFVIAAASMLYGRIYCSYLCPQMIFSEASLAVEDKIRRVINKRFIKMDAKKRQLLSRIGFYSVLGLASIFLAFVFISYFVEPRDLFWRLASLDIQTAGGIAGAATTLITFLDFTLVRQKFCTTICPYGYLQGILGDNNTLIVHYRDEDKTCIECKKCVRICHMGIDIRKSPYQIECIHCGECIDACADVLGRFGKESLIHYTWGEKGEYLNDKKVPWLRRLGLRDAKRMVVLLIILFYASGLFVALSMRDNVLVKIAPIRTTMYRIGEDGRIYNQFRMTVANRGKKDALLTLSLNNLPDAQIVVADNPLPLQAGEEVQTEFEIALEPNQAQPGVNYFQIVGAVTPDNTRETFDMTFIMPTERPKTK
ncbi:MAG: 4Fe-4S dicluster domain-containing protein [Acidobacteriota bacterium]